MRNFLHTAPPLIILTQQGQKNGEGLWKVMCYHEKYLPDHDRMDIVEIGVPKQILRGCSKIAIIALVFALGRKSFQEG